MRAVPAAIGWSQGSLHGSCKVQRRGCCGVVLLSDTWTTREQHLSCSLLELGAYRCPKRIHNGSQHDLHNYHNYRNEVVMVVSQQRPTWFFIVITAVMILTRAALPRSKAPALSDRRCRVHQTSMFPVQPAGTSCRLLGSPRALLCHFCVLLAA